MLSQNSFSLRSSMTQVDIVTVLQGGHDTLRRLYSLRRYIY